MRTTGSSSGRSGGARRKLCVRWSRRRSRPRARASRRRVARSLRGSRMAECANCGRELPEGSRFCLECGTPVDAAKETVVEEVPAHEPEAAPVEPQVAERRFFGVPPSSALLVLGLAALVAAVVLFATGNWPWALILLGVSLFLLTGFVSQVRRLPTEASSAGLAKASL